MKGKIDAFWGTTIAPLAEREEGAPPSDRGSAMGQCGKRASV